MDHPVMILMTFHVSYKIKKFIRIFYMNL